jgi:signal transduction histidine kinase
VRRRGRVLAFLTFVLVCMCAVAWPAVTNAETTPISILGTSRGRVGTRAEIFEDTTGKRSPGDVATAMFVPLDPAHANRGYTSSAFWLRITLANPSPSAETAILELAPALSHADLYDASGTQLLMRSGASLPFGARSVRHPSIAFRLVLAASETRTLLIRVESRDTLIVDPIVWREDAFSAAAQRLHLLDGLYYGIILGLAVYNLFLAYATRERAYLAYVGFQVAMATANAAIDKYTFQFFWPNSPVWAARSEQVLNMLALAAAMLCARWLLDTPKLAPRIDRALRGIGAVALVMGAVATLADATPLALVSIAGVFLIGITMLVVAATVVARAGSPHGRIFLVAWAVLFAGTFFAGLAAIGVLQTLAGYDLLKIGSAAEAMLLSIGLAARIRTIQAERTRAREELLVERSRRIESLSRLVAGVAHELGNPLNFAKGGAAALGSVLARLDTSDAATASASAATSTASARRALVLVESGLERISRMVRHLRSDLGDRQARATSVDVRVELDDALEMLASWLDARHVEVRRDDGDDGDALHVLSRSGDLAQVFGNLARNAGDAMASGGILHVTLRRDGIDAVIAFRDEGPGVPADLQATIFEPFFTTRTSEDGVGLGLYVSKEIVARWGGSVILASDAHDESRDTKRGATFVVRVPLTV